MLVLTRRATDAIVFPNLGITINILRLNRQAARIGIEAPSDVRVLRKEIADESSELDFDPEIISSLIKRNTIDSHAIRNQLNTLNLGIYLYRDQMEAGLVDEANTTFLRIIEQLTKVDQQVAAGEVDAPLDRNDMAAKIKLLLVEDDAEQRELLAGTLTMRGCEVATACDGQDAMDYLAANEWPDFLLMDLRMPRCDGALAVQQIRQVKSHPDLKIVAVSATEPEEMGIRVGEGGVDFWFPKPLNPEGLVRYMRQSSIETA